MRTATHSITHLCLEGRYSIWRSIRSLRNEVVAEGVCSGRGPRSLTARPNLFIDVGDMPLRRPAAQHKLLGYLLVALARRYQAQHFYLPFGQVVRVRRLTLRGR